MTRFCLGCNGHNMPTYRSTVCFMIMKIVDLYFFEELIQLFLLSFLSLYTEQPKESSFFLCFRKFSLLVVVMGLANSLSIYLLLLFLMIICVPFKLDVFFSFVLQTTRRFILFVYDLTGVPVRAINRPGSQLLGANGRDDGPIVSFFLPFRKHKFLQFLSSLVYREHLRS